MKKGLLFLLFLIVGCQSYPELTFKDVSYEQKSSIVLEGGQSTDVHFIIPNCEQNEEVCDEINQFFVRSTAQILGFEKGKQNKTYDDLAKQFIQSYDKLHKVLPTDVVPWEAKIQGHVEDTDSLVNAYLSYYVFSGGTSIEEGVKSGFFDKSTQKQVAVKDLFLNYVQFEKIVEQQFVTQFGDYRSKEFYFEKELFRMGQNHYIKDNYWIVNYATGEIAPMYKGVFEVKIPMEELQSVLNPIYF